MSGFVLTVAVLAVAAAAVIAATAWAERAVDAQVARALDQAADDEWAAILAAVAVTPEEVRAAYIEQAVADLRHDIAAWEARTW